MKTLLSAFLACCILAAVSAVAAPAAAKPNVIITVTDDQGFGELGVTGNPGCVAVTQHESSAFSIPVHVGFRG